MRKFKEFMYEYSEFVLIALAVVLILIVLICFGINSSTGEVDTITKVPAWLEWERAYGRQGF